MAVTRRRPSRSTAASSSRSPSPLLIAVLTEGDWIDMMDHDGVWNVARVLSVPSPGEIEVTYDGWPSDYDEVVRVDSDRVAPYHTFTWAVKCWVKYLNWPLWPSIITIRTPGTSEGIKNLAMENRLHVDFLDAPNFAARDRCWQKKRQVMAFDKNYDRNRMETIGVEFEQALGCVLQSDATTQMPTFVRGTLPVQYEHSTTESVEKMRKEMGKERWYQNFVKNRVDHMQAHAYLTIGADEEDSLSDEAVPVPKLEFATSDKDYRVNTQKKKRTNLAKAQHATKIDKEPLTKIEEPHELEEMDGNVDQRSNREQEAANAEKRRLHVRRRPDVSPVTNRAMPKKRRLSTSPEENNIAPSKSRHFTVVMDEIIIDDDEDSEDDGVDHWDIARNVATSSRKLPLNNTPTHEENNFFMNQEERIRSTPNRAGVQRHKKEPGRTTQEESLDGLAVPKASRQRKPAKTLKASLSLIEQQIAIAEVALRDLNKEKQKATTMEQRRRSLFASHDRSQPITSKAKKVESRAPQPEILDLSFLQAEDKNYGSRVNQDHQGRITEAPLGSNLLHRPLPVDEPYSSDSQESKGAPVDFDEDSVHLNEANCAEKAEAKSLAQSKIDADADADAKQLAEDDEVGREENSQEVYRRVCTVGAGSEGTLHVDIDIDDKTKAGVSKKTWISVPRKFDAPTAEASLISTSLTDSMLRISSPPSLPPPRSDGRSSVKLESPSAAVFSSSEGFSMENWLKRSLAADYRSSMP